MSRRRYESQLCGIREVNGNEYQRKNRVVAAQELRGFKLYGMFVVKVSSFLYVSSDARWIWHGDCWVSG